MPRPLIFAFAGVNGAGKSTAGARVLGQTGQAWFNPDAYARNLLGRFGCTQPEANAEAWQEGMRRLEQAIAQGGNFAFETTLGGNTVTRKLREATATHDVSIWFTGLDSPERHLARIRFRVARGGHDIPAEKVRERYDTSRRNLIALMPFLSQLQVYDNSVDAVSAQPLPNPRLLLQMEERRIACPTDIETLKGTPEWAKPILMAALSMQ